MSLWFVSIAASWIFRLSDFFFSVFSFTDVLSYPLTISSALNTR